MENNTVTSANEPMIAHPLTSYNDVMSYLHSIRISRADKEKVARRLTVEVTQPALADAYDRVDHLAMLQKNWDGEGALPISPKVIRNIKSALMISDNADWQNWSISPDGNATLGLQSKKQKALISIGAREFSYFAMVDGQKCGDSHVPFTPEALLGVMRRFEYYPSPH